MKKIIIKYNQWLRYLIVGGLTTGINILSFYLLARVLGTHYLVANAAAWALSVLFAFSANKRFVFGSGGSGKTLAEFFSFVLCRVGSGLLDMALMFLLIDEAHLDEMVVKLLVNILVIILNYYFSKWVVFKEANEKWNAKRKRSA